MVWLALNRCTPHIWFNFPKLSSLSIYHFPLTLHLFFLNFLKLGKWRTTSYLVANVSYLGLVLGSSLTVNFHIQFKLALKEGWPLPPSSLTLVLQSPSQWLLDSCPSITHSLQCSQNEFLRIRIWRIWWVAPLLKKNPTNISHFLWNEVWNFIVVPFAETPPTPNTHHTPAHAHTHACADLANNCKF